MSATALISRQRGTGSSRPVRRPAPRPVPRRSGTLAVPRPRPPEPKAIAQCWQLALDAAESALRAATASLPAAELERRSRDLAWERQQIAESLARLARIVRLSLVPPPVP